MAQINPKRAFSKGELWREMQRLRNAQETLIATVALLIAIADARSSAATVTSLYCLTARNSAIAD